MKKFDSVRVRGSVQRLVGPHATGGVGVFIFFPYVGLVVWRGGHDAFPELVAERFFGLIAQAGDDQAEAGYDV